MQIVGATRQGLAIKPHFPFFGNPIVVRIREFPNLRRSGHIDRAFMPKDAGGKHQSIREDGFMIENSIAISILQPQYQMGLFPQLIFHGFIRPRGFGNEETAFVIEAGLHRAGNQWHSCRHLERVAFRNLEGKAVDHSFGGMAPADQERKSQENKVIGHAGTSP